MRLTASALTQQESGQPAFQQQSRALAASGSMHDSVSSGDQRGGEGSKEGGNGEPMDAETRAERTKAKNKKAQKKFRQKQKERHAELERSAAELAERLKNTLAEVDGLQNQKKVLEIALSRNTQASTTVLPTLVSFFGLLGPPVCLLRTYKQFLATLRGCQS